LQPDVLDTVPILQPGATAPELRPPAGEDGTAGGAGRLITEEGMDYTTVCVFVTLILFGAALASVIRGLLEGKKHGKE